MFKIILAASAATSINVNVDMQNVERDGDIVKAVFQVQNTETTPYSSVFVECAFLDKDKRALDVVVAHVQNVQPNTTRYGKASLVRPANDVVAAKCYVDVVR